MRFALIDAEKAEFPVRTMCRVLDVSESGLLFTANRAILPVSVQRDDMIYLAAWDSHRLRVIGTRTLDGSPTRMRRSDRRG